MLTLDALRAYGANVEEGMNRCFGKEAFYFRLIGMALADANFDRLKSAVETGDGKAAFEAAHALKGSIGNLALTPIYDPVSRLTELLRGQSTTPPEAAPLLAEVLAQLEKARRLAE